MTEPNEVLEEMARAAANATMNVPVTKEEWDALPKSTKKPFFGRVKAALRAARELGYFLVPEIMNMKMSEAQLEDWTNCAQDEWQAAIRAAPDILAEGE